MQQHVQQQPQTIGQEPTYEELRRQLTELAEEGPGGEPEEALEGEPEEEPDEDDTRKRTVIRVLGALGIAFAAFIGILGALLAVYSSSAPFLTQLFNFLGLRGALGFITGNAIALNDFAMMFGAILVVYAFLLVATSLFGFEVTRDELQANHYIAFLALGIVVCIVAIVWFWPGGISFMLIASIVNLVADIVLIVFARRIKKHREKRIEAMRDLLQEMVEV